MNNVQIYIFQDRVEIVNPGGLLAGMIKADLGKKSIPRNPLLFSILYRMNAANILVRGSIVSIEHARTIELRPLLFKLKKTGYPLSFYAPQQKKI